jgi:hypothetical protein
MLAGLELSEKAEEERWRVFHACRHRIKEAADGLKSYATNGANFRLGEKSNATDVQRMILIQTQIQERVGEFEQMQQILEKATEEIIRSRREERRNTRDFINAAIETYLSEALPTHEYLPRGEFPFIHLANEAIPPAARRPGVSAGVFGTREEEEEEDDDEEEGEEEGDAIVIDPTDNLQINTS